MVGAAANNCRLWKRKVKVHFVREANFGKALRAVEPFTILPGNFIGGKGGEGGARDKIIIMRIGL